MTDGMIKLSKPSSIKNTEVNVCLLNLNNKSDYRDSQMSQFLTIIRDFK